MPHYGDYQNLIYGAGLGGVVPKVPVDFATLVRRAEAAMPPYVLNYVQGGCGDEVTQERNRSAFDHWGMVPRMMVDSAARDGMIGSVISSWPSPRCSVSPRCSDGVGGSSASCSFRSCGC